jgi:photosystem II stability/assembly factor-like uncharacterized protein
MKKVAALMVSLSFMSCIHSQWSNQNPNINDELVSVHFTDPVNGYVAAHSGVVLKTSDGGVNWETTYTPPGAELSSVCFLTPDTGYIAGAGGVIMKTTDGGANWSSVSNGSNFNFTSIFFIDTQTGYVAGKSDGSTILKTVDGGDTWDTCLTLPEFSLSKITFPDAGHGFAIGALWDASPLGIIVKTTDGGDTWTDTVISEKNHPLISISMVTADTGYIFSWSGLWKTTDGWENWTELKCPLTSTSPIFFTGHEVGYGVGSFDFETTIMKTTDGGITWEDQYTSLFTDIFDIYFPEHDSGYAVGHSWETHAGLVFSTTNGGAPLNIFESPANSWFVEMYPNPVQSMLVVNFLEPFPTNPQLKLFNCYGARVLQKQITSTRTAIDLSHFPAGVYFVRIEIYDEIVTRKVVVH